MAALPVFAQPNEFDAASIKRGELIEPIRQSTPGRVTYRNYMVKKFVMEAYRLTRYQVEGPPWIKENRFDIIATKPAGTTSDQERDVACWRRDFMSFSTGRHALCRHTFCSLERTRRSCAP